MKSFTGMRLRRWIKSFVLAALTGVLITAASNLAFIATVREPSRRYVHSGYVVAGDRAFSLMRTWTFAWDDCVWQDSGHPLSAAEKAELVATSTKEFESMRAAPVTNPGSLLWSVPLPPQTPVPEWLLALSRPESTVIAQSIECGWPLRSFRMRSVELFDGPGKPRTSATISGFLATPAWLPIGVVSLRGINFLPASPI